MMTYGTIGVVVISPSDVCPVASGDPVHKEGGEGVYPINASAPIEYDEYSPNAEYS